MTFVLGQNLAILSQKFLLQGTQSDKKQIAAKVVYGIQNRRFIIFKNQCFCLPTGVFSLNNLAKSSFLSRVGTQNDNRSKSFVIEFLQNIFDGVGSSQGDFQVFHSKFWRPTLGQNHPAN